MSPAPSAVTSSGFELLRSDGSDDLHADRERGALRGDDRRPGAHRADRVGGACSCAGRLPPGSMRRPSSSPSLDEFFALDAESGRRIRVHGRLDRLPRKRRTSRARGSSSGATTRRERIRGARSPARRVDRFPCRPAVLARHIGRRCGCSTPLYYGTPAQARRCASGSTTGPFFYPLDSDRALEPHVRQARLLPVPVRRPAEPVRAMRWTRCSTEIARSGQGSFLAVLKQLRRPAVARNALASRGPGVDPRARLPECRARPRWRCSTGSRPITLAADGALYPAKDARMSARGVSALVSDARRVPASCRSAVLRLRSGGE